MDSPLGRHHGCLNVFKRVILFPGFGLTTRQATTLEPTILINVLCILCIYCCALWEQYCPCIELAAKRFKKPMAPNWPKWTSDVGPQFLARIGWFGSLLHVLCSRPGGWWFWSLRGPSPVRCRLLLFHRVTQVPWQISWTFEVNIFKISRQMNINHQKSIKK